MKKTEAHKWTVIYKTNKCEIKTNIHLFLDTSSRNVT